MISMMARHPFGPAILEAECPNSIIDGLNDLIDEMPKEKLEICSSKYNSNIPNLLNRGFEILYLLKEDVEKLSYNDYLLAISSEYLRYLNRSAEGLYLPDPIFSDKFYDVWVNRYFRGDITPPHGHAHYLSGVTILKLPTDGNDLPMDQDPCRSLEFLHNDEVYLPEQKVGMTYIFPSHLRHWVHFQVCETERRTVSFNIAI